MVSVETFGALQSILRSNTDVTSPSLKSFKTHSAQLDCNEYGSLRSCLLRLSAIEGVSGKTRPGEEAIKASRVGKYDKTLLSKAKDLCMQSRYRDMQELQAFKSLFVSNSR